MASVTRTDTLDNIFTTTYRLRKKDIADNVFKKTPTFYYLTKKGRFKDVRGGIGYEMPVEWASNQTATFIGKGGTVALDDTEFLKPATYTWAYLAGNVTRFMVEEQQNQGQARVIDLVTAKYDNLEKTLINTVEEKLFTAQAGLAPYGLPDLVAEDPTTGTVAGLNRAVETYFRNQYRDESTRAAISYLRSDMTNMWNRCSQMGQAVQGSPSIMVTDQTVYELYDDEIFEVAEGRIDEPGLKDIGLGDLSFKGKPLTWSPALSTALGRMYFLNLDKIWIMRDPSLWFKMTKWKDIPNQTEDRVAQVVSAYQLMTNSPASLGVLFDISVDGSM